MNRKCAWIAAYLGLSATGCAGVQTVPKEIRSPTQLSETDDGRVVLVKGYLRTTETGPFLYVDEVTARLEDVARGVDVVFSAKYFGKVHKLADGCTQVEGRFTRFDEDAVGLGNLTSEIGVVETSPHEVRPVPCD